MHVDVPIVGDCAYVLEDMIKFWKAKLCRPEAEALAAWWRQIDAWRERDCLRYRNSNKLIKPQYALQRLEALTKDRDRYVCTEVGQHQMWAAQFFKYSRPRTFLSSGGLGTMGYGLPAALGAQAAFPKRQVIDISGDGSFQMNSQELATLVQYRLPVKIVILNNNFLGMVRQWQQLFFDKRYSQTCLELPIDFKKLAEAYGATGLTCSKPGEVEATIKQAFATDGPVIMEFKVAREENVMPMVPAGAGLNEMVLAS